MSLGGFTAAAAKVVLGVESEQFLAGMHGAEAEYAVAVARMGGSTAELAERQIRAEVASKRYQAALKQFGVTAVDTRAALGTLVGETRKLTDVQTAGTASTARFERGLLAGTARGFGFGRALSFASNAFLGGAGFIYAVHSAINASQKFQGEMTLLQTQALSTHREVQRMTKSVLALAPALATSPMELSKGLYHVESAGIRGARALKVLTTAAKGARLGHADLEATTTALVAAQKSGIAGAHNLGQAMGTLDAIIGAGNMRMEDLARAMSSGMVPAAQQFGLSLQQLGGALATLTVQGQPAELAATRLRYSIALLGAQTPKAEKELRSIGITTTQLGDMLRSQGLVPALQLLDTKLKSAGLSATMQARLLERAFGGGRSFTTILNLLQHLDMLREKTNEIDRQGSAIQFGKRWDAQVLTAEYAFARLRANAERTKIFLGNALLPAAVGASKGISDWLEQGHNQLRLQRDLVHGFHDVKEAGKVFAEGMHQVAAVMHGLDSALGGGGHSLKLMAELFLLLKARNMLGRANVNFLDPVRATSARVAQEINAVQNAAANAEANAAAAAAAARTARLGREADVLAPVAGQQPWRLQEVERAREAEQAAAQIEEARAAEAAATEDAATRETKAQAKVLKAENDLLQQTIRGEKLRAQAVEQATGVIVGSRRKETAADEQLVATETAAQRRVAAAAAGPNTASAVSYAPGVPRPFAGTHPNEPILLQAAAREVQKGRTTSVRALMENPNLGFSYEQSAAVMAQLAQRGVVSRASGGGYRVAPLHPEYAYGEQYATQGTSPGTVIRAKELARVLKIPVGEATQLLGQLAGRGVLEPNVVQGRVQGYRTLASAGILPGPEIDSYERIKQRQNARYWEELRRRQESIASTQITQSFDKKSGLPIVQIASTKPKRPSRLPPIPGGGVSPEVRQLGRQLIQMGFPQDEAARMLRQQFPGLEAHQALSAVGHIPTTVAEAPPPRRLNEKTGKWEPVGAAGYPAAKVYRPKPLPLTNVGGRLMTPLELQAEASYKTSPAAAEAAARRAAEQQAAKEARAAAKLQAAADREALKQERAALREAKSTAPKEARAAALEAKKAAIAGGASPAGVVAAEAAALQNAGRAATADAAATEKDTAAKKGKAQATEQAVKLSTEEAAALDRTVQALNTEVAGDEKSATTKKGKQQASEQAAKAAADEAKATTDLSAADERAAAAAKQQKTTRRGAYAKGPDAKALRSQARYEEEAAKAATDQAAADQLLIERNQAKAESDLKAAEATDANARAERGAAKAGQLGGTTLKQSKQLTAAAAQKTDAAKGAATRLAEKNAALTQAQTRADRQATVAAEAKAKADQDAAAASANRVKTSTVATKATLDEAAAQNGDAAATTKATVAKKLKTTASVEETAAVEQTAKATVDEAAAQNGDALAAEKAAAAEALAARETLALAEAEGAARVAAQLQTEGLSGLDSAVRRLTADERLLLEQQSALGRQPLALERQAALDRQRLRRTGIQQELTPPLYGPGSRTAPRPRPAISVGGKGYVTAAQFATSREAMAAQKEAERQMRRLGGEAGGTASRLAGLRRGFGGFGGMGDSGGQRAMGAGLMLMMFGDQVTRLPGLHGGAGHGAADMMMGAGTGLMFAPMLGIKARYGAAVGASFGLKKAIGGRPGSTRAQVGSVLGNVGEGAAVGATIGSVVPGIGTGLGAGVGATVGLAASLASLGHHSDQTAAKLMHLGDAAQMAAGKTAAAKQAIFAGGIQLANDKVTRDQAKAAVASAKAEEVAARGTKDHHVALDALRAAQANYRGSVAQVNADLKGLAKAHKDAAAGAKDSKKANAELVNELMAVSREATDTKAHVAAFGRGAGVMFVTPTQKLQQYIKRMDGLSKSMQKSNPRLAAVARALARIAAQVKSIPDQKTITIFLKYGAVRAADWAQHVRPDDRGGLRPIPIVRKKKPKGGAGDLTSPPFSDQMPQSMQTELLQAQYSGNVAAQKKVLEKELHWLQMELKRAHNDAERASILQQLISVKGELSTLESKGIRKGGLGLIPQPLQDRLARAEQRHDKPGEIKALEAEAAWLRRYKDAPGRTPLEHRKATDLLTQVVRHLERLNRQVAGNISSLIPFKLQEREQLALQNVYTKGGNVKELKAERETVLGYLHEKGHTPAEYKEARRRLRELNRQIREAGKPGAGYGPVIDAIQAEIDWLRRYEHKRSTSLKMRLAADKEIARKEKQIAAYEAKGGAPGLIPGNLQIAYQKALRTPGKEDDIATLKAEQKWLQRWIASHPGSGKLQVEANKLLSSIDGRLAKLVGKNDALARMEIKFLAEMAGFFASFGSNVFTQDGVNRSPGANDGTGGRTGGHPGSGGGNGGKLGRGRQFDQVVVHQHFPAGHPTEDRNREARLANHAARAALD